MAVKAECCLWPLSGTIVETITAVQDLNLVIDTTAKYNRSGILTESQATTLTTLAAVGIKMMQQ